MLEQDVKLSEVKEEKEEASQTVETKSGTDLEREKTIVKLKVSEPAVTVTSVIIGETIFE